MKAIEFEGVCRSFWRKEDVLSEVDLRVERGEKVGILGPEGAGKTTLLRVAAGILHVHAGTVRTLGLDPREDQLAVKQRLGYVSEQQTLDPRLRIDEVFAMHRQLFPSWCPDLERRLRDHIDFVSEARVKTLNLEGKRLLLLCCALAHRPELLILDRPGAGLPPEVGDEILQIAEESLRNEGTTFLVSGRELREVEPLAKRALILLSGKPRLDAPLEALRRGGIQETLDGLRREEIVWLDELDTSLQESQAEPESRPQPATAAGSFVAARENRSMRASASASQREGEGSTGSGLAFYGKLFRRSFWDVQLLLCGHLLVLAGILSWMSAGIQPSVWCQTTLSGICLGAVARRHLGPMAHLPLRAAPVVFSVALPCTFWLLLGFGIPGAVEVAKNSRAELGWRYGELSVPGRHWVDWTEPGSPSLVAPWGERFELVLEYPHREEFSCLAGSGVLYNPYAVPRALEFSLDPGGRERFERVQAWQLSRALRDVHGIELSVEEARARVIETKDPSRALAELVGASKRTEPRYLAAFALLFVMVWLGGMQAFGFSSFGARTRVGQWIRGVVLYGMGALAPLLLFELFLFGRGAREVHDWAWHRFAYWITSPVPADPWALGAWVALFGIAATALARWQLRGVEWGWRVQGKPLGALP